MEGRRPRLLIVTNVFITVPGAKSAGSLLSVAAIVHGHAQLKICEYVLREYLRTIGHPRWTHPLNNVTRVLTMIT